MKKALRFFGALIAFSVAAVGCTNENLLQELNGSPVYEVGVNAYVTTATRGVSVENKSDLQGQGIELFAFLGSSRDLFMGSESKGVGFTYDRSKGKWDYENPAEKKYWEQTNDEVVRFVALSPMLKDFPEGSFTFNMDYTSTTCLTHEVPTDVTKQLDVLYADYNTSGVARDLLVKNGVGLQFRHSTAQIVCSGKIRDDSKSVIRSVKVNSVQFKNVKSTLYIGLQALASVIVSSGDPARNFTVAFTPSFSNENMIKNTDGVVELSNSKCALFLPPQILSNVVMEVNAVMTFVSGEEVNISYSNNMSGWWQIGKKHVYTLVFSTDKISPIEVSPSVMLWEEVETEIELEG